jgi:transposase
MLVTEETVKFRVLRRQGKNIRKIARIAGPVRNTVRRYLRSEGVALISERFRNRLLQPISLSIER